TVEVTGDKAPHRYKIKESLPDNSLNFTITAELSSDGSTLWIYAGLYELPAGKVPSEPLLALLTKNDDIGPQFFSYSAASKLLYLNAPAAAGDVTPSVMRLRLKKFINTLDATKNLWDTEKWK